MRRARWASGLGRRPPPSYPHGFINDAVDARHDVRRRHRRGGCEPRLKAIAVRVLHEAVAAGLADCPRAASLLIAVQRCPHDARSDAVPGLRARRRLDPAAAHGPAAARLRRRHRNAAGRSRSAESEPSGSVDGPRRGSTTVPRSPGGIRSRSSRSLARCTGRPIHRSVETAGVLAGLRMCPVRDRHSVGPWHERRGADPQCRALPQVWSGSRTGSNSAVSSLNW
jgi:hypothetical protein